MFAHPLAPLPRADDSESDPQLVNDAPDYAREPDSTQRSIFDSTYHMPDAEDIGERYRQQLNGEEQEDATEDAAHSDAEPAPESPAPEVPDEFAPESPGPNAELPSSEFEQEEQPASEAAEEQTADEAPEEQEEEEPSSKKARVAEDVEGGEQEVLEVPSDDEPDEPHTLDKELEDLLGLLQHFLYSIFL